jgi:anti-sigma B factor antagonist
MEVVIPRDLEKHDLATVLRMPVRFEAPNGRFQGSCDVGLVTNIGDCAKPDRPTRGMSLGCPEANSRNVSEGQAGDRPENHMHINQRIVGDVAIVEVIGDIVANSGDALLKDKVGSLRQQGYTRVVVDLGKVPYMDSAGLGDLVLAYATMKKSGGTLKLMRVTKRLQDVLTITKLVSVFDTYDDEAAALASFAAVA